MLRSCRWARSASRDLLPAAQSDCGDLQRLVDQLRRSATDGKHCYDVRAGRAVDVRRQYACAIQRYEKRNRTLSGPFRARQYPFAPFWTLACMGVCVASLVYHTRPVAVLFAGLLAVGYLGLRLSWRPKRARRTNPKIVEEHSQP